MRRTFLVLPMLLLAACRHTSPPDAAQVDSALAGFVPADALVLAETQIQGPDGLQATPVYKKYLAGSPLPQLDEFARRTGLDPRKDVAVLLFCSNGKQSVLMARGRFSADGLEQKLTQQGAARFDYKGRRLFGDEKNAVVFVNQTIAIAGSTPLLRSILDGNGRTAAPAWLTAQVQTIPAASQLWAAFGGGALQLPFPEDSNLGNLNHLARAIETGVLYADLRNGIDLAANGICTTDAGAKQVHDALKGFIGLGRLTTPDNRPEMLRLYDSFQVNQNQRAVGVKANIPLELVDRFFKMIR
ncbi:MAG: hypothetical protein ABI165_01235 [Bryobacteraceae bacterium]